MGNRKRQAALLSAIAQIDPDRFIGLVKDGNTQSVFTAVSMALACVADARRPDLIETLKGAGQPISAAAEHWDSFAATRFAVMRAMIGDGYLAACAMTARAWYKLGSLPPVRIFVVEPLRRGRVMVTALSGEDATAAAVLNDVLAQRQVGS